MPRPLHRWKSFWLGIFVLTFLGWGWVRSMTRMDGIFWLSRGYITTAGQSSGGVSLNWDESQAPFPISTFKWVHEPAPPNEPWFSKAVNFETYPGMIQLTIAHWFLMLLFLIVWIAFLVWRIRRQPAPDNGE